MSNLDSPVPMDAHDRVKMVSLLIRLLLPSAPRPTFAPGLFIRETDLTVNSPAEALAFRFGVDVLLVFGERLNLLLHFLDSLDESAELITRNATWSAPAALLVFSWAAVG